MRKQNGSATVNWFTTLTIAGSLMFGAAAGAQPASVEEVQDFLGTWNLAAIFQETPVELVLEIIDEDGEVKAALSAALSPEPQLMESITRTAEGLVLAYNASFGTNSIRIEVKVALEAGGVVGSFGDQNGLFKADFTGERGESTGLVAEATLAAAAAADAPGQPPRRRGSLQALLDLGSGKELRIKHAGLMLDSDDHRSLLATAPGEVFGYGSSRTIKLLTDADLVFGETRVRAFNLAPNYPGCYAIWLKRVEDGWHLVFNEQADMWGTQYDPETDVAEIPLELAELETPREELLVELAEEEGGGRLRIVWGNQAWSASFQAD